MNIARLALPINMAAPVDTSPSGSGTKTKNVKRKRNKAGVEADEMNKGTSKKQKNEEKFSDIEFKVMFKDPNTTFAGKHER